VVERVREASPLSAKGPNGVQKFGIFFSPKGVTLLVAIAWQSEKTQLWLCR
jgi:hypothetical protein